MEKLYLGIAPFNEQHPNIGHDGRGMVLQVGAIWKEQLIRFFRPNFIVLINIEQGLPNGEHFEVVLTINNMTEEKKTWLNAVEHDEVIPGHWDEISLNQLEKLGWLINMRSK